MELDRILWTLPQKKGTCMFMQVPEFFWLRERDLNPRPSGYEPDELPNCSIPRQRLPTLTELIVAVNHFLTFFLQSVV